MKVDNLEDVKRIYFVPAGGYGLSKGTPQLLAACLGTCVGVGLVDKHRKIGALAHVIIPARCAEVEIEAEGSLCAAETVPFLLEKLIGAGAEKEDLIAGIAGGLSFEGGWVNYYGAMSLSFIKNSLKEAGIPIVFLETMDHLNASFVLDVRNAAFFCKDLFGESLSHTREESIEYSKIEKAINKIRPMSSVVLKIIELLGTENFKITEVVEEIKKDEVMIAKLLKICNSAMFSPAKKIDSVEKAVIFLGSRNLLKLIFSAYLEEFFGEGKGYSLRINGIYNHSMVVGVISELIAKEVGIPADVAYTYGMLHDIGKRVLDIFASKQKKILYAELVKGRNLLEVEKELFKKDHCEVGNILASKWNFPLDLQEVILHHHNPRGRGKYTKVVYLADVMANHFFSGHIIDETSISYFDDTLEDLGLSYSHLQEIMKRIPYKRLINEEE